jgi:hypothetical protein
VVCARLRTWKKTYGFFSSLGLSMFSIVARPGGEAAVARVQKWRMVVAVASVVVTFSLRVAGCVRVHGGISSPRQWCRT